MMPACLLLLIPWPTGGWMDPETKMNIPTGKSVEPIFGVENWKDPFVNGPNKVGK